jgi:hypothetical protein
MPGGRTEQKPVYRQSERNNHGCDSDELAHGSYVASSPVMSERHVNVQPTFTP